MPAPLFTVPRHQPLLTMARCSRFSAFGPKSPNGCTTRRRAIATCDFSGAYINGPYRTGTSAQNCRKSAGSVVGGAECGADGTRRTLERAPAQRVGPAADAVSGGRTLLREVVASWSSLSASQQIAVLGIVRHGAAQCSLGEAASIPYLIHGVKSSTSGDIFRHVWAVVEAAASGGWRIARFEQAVSGSVYMRLMHPERKRVIVRVSDHRSRGFKHDPQRRVFGIVSQRYLGAVVSLLKGGRDDG